MTDAEFMAAMNRIFSMSDDEFAAWCVAQFRNGFEPQSAKAKEQEDGLKQRGGLQ